MNSRRRRLNVIVLSTTLAVIFGTGMTSTNSVWAATIHCPNSAVVPPFFVNCLGTDNNDNMIGTTESDSMEARGGNDIMSGFGSSDRMFGGDGDDTVSGGSANDLANGNARSDNVNGDSGDDTVVGDFGPDTLKGNSGNDKIYQWVNDGVNVPTSPDGSKDTVDCGSGNDEAFINTSVDHDTAASNCETVHEG